MTYWAQLLHFYQPPTQSHDVLKRVANESYRPVLGVLREHPAAKLAVNMNGVLTELLIEHGLRDVVDGLRELAERGQVEFVGSGKFHPILPLIPEDVCERSIRENNDTNAAAFNESWKPRGFFPPELCFNSKIVKPIVASGHEWLLLSGIACPAEWPIDQVYRTTANGQTIATLFRDDARSNRISFRETDPAAFIKDLSLVGAGAPAYVLTAMDAETYGHHVRGWERQFLAATYQKIAEQPLEPAMSEVSRVEIVLPSKLLDLFPAGPAIEPLPSSWSTSDDDIANHNPFPLWRAPGNRVHELQWEYVEHCLGLLEVANRHATNATAREFATIADEKLQPALHSCQFWWASRRPMWDVPMIHRGFLLLNEVALFASKATAEGSANECVKREARWRLAAANETRAQLERELFTGGS